LDFQTWPEPAPGRHGIIGGSGLSCGRPRLQHVFCARRAVNAGEVMPHIIAEYCANLQRGPGRHGITSAFLPCTRDSDGQRVELFTPDYLTVEPDFEPLRRSLREAAPAAQPIMAR
jgi:catechol 2,3-dioxygenase